MKHRTLWSAVDVDRSRWWQYAAYIVLCLVLIGGAFWLWSVTGYSGRGFRVVIQAAAVLVPIVVFPLVRAKKAKAAIQRFGAIVAPQGTIMETKRALADVSLSRGQKPPPLYLFHSPAINAISYKEKGVERLAVSSAFAELPMVEQRAGIAMLLGRNIANLDSIVLAAGGGIPTDKDGNTCKVSDLADPKIRDKAMRSWLEAAVAGDHQGLLLTKDPKAMLTLLKRLSFADTYLFMDSIEVGYCCLAWPFGGDGKADTDDTLPPKAREALAEFLSRGGSSAAYPELARLARLKEVLPAAEREVPEPVPVGSAGPVGKNVPASAPLPSGAPTTVTATAIAPGLTIAATAVIATVPMGDAVGGQGPAGVVQGPAAVAGLAAATAPEVAPPEVEAPRLKAVKVTGPRIARTCPHCSARNVPTNATCIACGRPLPAMA